MLGLGHSCTIYGNVSSCSSSATTSTTYDNREICSPSSTITYNGENDCEFFNKMRRAKRIVRIDDRIMESAQFAVVECNRKKVLFLHDCNETECTVCYIGNWTNFRVRANEKFSFRY